MRQPGRFPPFSAAPLAAMSYALGRSADMIKRNHPELLDRMGSYAAAVFLVDPVDLPVEIRIQPQLGIVECLRRPSDCGWDARIAGPLAKLVAMVQGTLDGDALFFSRDITIEGDTEAILALRNAIDASEVDLALEFAELCGPFMPLANNLARITLKILGRVAGVTLVRQ